MNLHRRVTLRFLFIIGWLMISPNTGGETRHSNEGLGLTDHGSATTRSAIEMGDRTNEDRAISPPSPSHLDFNNQANIRSGSSSVAVGSPVSSYPIAIWLTPGREYQWKLWETSSALARLVKTSINKTVQATPIPAFQPHATLCTGEILYSSLKDLEEKLLKLRHQVREVRDTMTNRADGRLQLRMGSIGFGNWWSQFLYIHLSTEGWPFGTNRTEALNAFSTLSNRFGLSMMKDAMGTNHDLMPHISLLYCPTDRIPLLNNQISRDEWTQTIRSIPWDSEITFEAIQIATPMPYSTNWEDLVNGDRLPYSAHWRILDTCPLGNPSTNSGGKLTQLVSGGQTGPDLAGLRAGLQSGLKTGGWCPPDGRNEAGEISPEFMLKRTCADASPDAPGIPRSLRTQLNVRDSEATLILWPDGLALDEKRFVGTLYTSWTAARFGKPLLFCNPNPEDSSAIATVVHWLRERCVTTLNVAGPLESSSPCVGENSYRFLLSVIEQVKSELVGDDLYPGAQ